MQATSVGIKCSHLNGPVRLFKATKTFPVGIAHTAPIAKDIWVFNIGSVMYVVVILQPTDTNSNKLVNARKTPTLPHQKGTLSGNVIWNDLLSHEHSRRQ